MINQDGKYIDMPHKEFETEADAILKLWNEFVESNDPKLTPNDYYIHHRNLFEVIKRIDKRKTYYYVFHKIKEICEYKETGLLCYWINTLKPFFVINEGSKIYNCPNEMFSVYIILSVLEKIFKNHYPEDEFILPSKKMIQDYVYNFKYCDFNREATIAFIETLAKSYNIGMEDINDDFKDQYDD